jgi:hypothetical protein
MANFTTNLEWSDVNRLAVISTNISLTPVAADNPAANSFFWAAIAPVTESPGDELYLMYDYLAPPTRFLRQANLSATFTSITINGLSTPVHSSCSRNRAGATGGWPCLYLRREARH